MQSTISLLRHKLFIAIAGTLVIFHVGDVRAQTNIPALGKNTEKYTDVVVAEVLRGDTIRLESGETIKLIGVRAFGNPARKKKTSRDEYGFVVKETIDLEVPWEAQAQEFVQELLEGQHVRLEFDAVQKDDEYKTLAYVFLVDGNVFANARILERGFADLQIQAPNLKYAQQLRDAYREGRAYSHGIDE